MRRLPPGEQLLFIKGMSPVRARQIDYRMDTEFRADGKAGARPIYDENPLHRPVGTAWQEIRIPVEAGAGTSSLPEEVTKDAGEEAFELGLRDPALPP